MTYADYILKTGAELAAWEDAFGRYLYQSRFAGLDPILDVGPGRCWFTRQAPERIIGLDVEPELVAHYSAQGLSVRVGTVTDIPFPTGHFSGVFCCWLFEHLHEPDVALKEIRRILVAGGYACLIVPSARTVASTFYDDFTHVRPYTRTSLIQLAGAAGFERFRIGPLFWTRGTGRLAARAGVAQVVQALRLLDTVGRRVGLANHHNLVLEAWK
jgi:SAM-dependent methyltransferase